MEFCIEKAGGLRQLAIMADIPVSTLSNYKNEKTEITLSRLESIATATSVDFRWLATGSGSPDGPKAQQMRESEQGGFSNVGLPQSPAENRLTPDIAAECTSTLAYWLKQNGRCLEPAEMGEVVALLCEVYEEQGRINPGFIEQLMKLKGG